MSDTPKFEVIDRRKFKAEEEQEERRTPPPPPEPGAGPRLVVTEPKVEEPEPAPQQATEEAEAQPDLPPAPTAEESRDQERAYAAASERLEDLIRAQNPTMGALPPVTFENLVQQLYVSAMIQMGAGAQEGQRARVDILGARTTIDLLGVLAEKTKDSLSEAEDRTLRTVLFEVRMAFLELTSMISMQGVQSPVPPPGKF